MPKIVCPAGEPVAGGFRKPGGCLCRVEGQIVPDDTPSYHLLCTKASDQGGYAYCSTWREHRREGWVDAEHDIERRRKELIRRRVGYDPVADAVLAGEAPIEAMLD